MNGLDVIRLFLLGWISLLGAKFVRFRGKMTEKHFCQEGTSLRQTDLCLVCRYTRKKGWKEDKSQGVYISRMRTWSDP